jgi:carbon storage regulator CsrA
MLIVSRKHRESVTVSETNGAYVALKVTVLEIHGDSVRLGFEAGSDIAIQRSEVWERILSDSCLVDTKQKVQASDA